MTRSEAYAYIKQHNLQDEVKNTFGKNFTTVGTDQLVNFINSKAGNTPVQEEKQAPVTAVAGTPQEDNAENPLEAACVTFLGVLKDSGALDKLLKKL